MGCDLRNVVTNSQAQTSPSAVAIRDNNLNRVGSASAANAVASWLAWRLLTVSDASGVQQSVAISRGILVFIILTVINISVRLMTVNTRDIPISPISTRGNLCREYNWH